MFVSSSKPTYERLLTTLKTNFNYKNNLKVESL